MTTTLILVLDPPPAALHDDDPIGWTAGYVRGRLLEAGLTVRDCSHRPELLLGVERPPAPPGEPQAHTCPLPWCRKEFAYPNLLKMHMRSHTDADCRFCGQPYKVTGIHSHEKHCAANPDRPRPATPAPKPALRRHRPQAPSQPTVAPEPISLTPWRPPPEPVPMTKRRFDPDRVRAAAGDAAWEADPFR